MNLRTFIRSTGLALLATSTPVLARATKPRELQITRVVVQEARGRRLTPVAPNAYADYRGYDVSEPVLRIQTRQGLEGISRSCGSAETLRRLVGLDPFKLFIWKGDRITGAAEEHRDLLARLGGSDIALLDLLGKALHRPAAEVLGKQVRSKVMVYDSSLYMEDLLKREQLENVPFLKEPVPADPVELVVLKAQWILNTRPERFKAIKIKIGRMKWMPSFEEALARDIAVTNAVRKAVGQNIRIMVDANKAYAPRPLASVDYAQAVAESRVSFLEEMFPETDVASLHELKQRLRSAGNPVKLAAGESHHGGIPDTVYKQRFKSPKTSEPLIDVEQGDMNAHGFLRLRAKAAAQVGLGMTLAPHNFGSKLGFFAQVHLGLVTPNWEIAEIDDSEFPALQAPGIVLKAGMASLTGLPGLGVTLNEEFLNRPSLDFKA